MIHEKDKYNVPSGQLDEVIPADEPVFLLRGKDPTAHATIMAWLRDQPHMPSDKAQRVIAHANKMQAYCQSIET